MDRPIFTSDFPFAEIIATFAVDRLYPAASSVDLFGTVALLHRFRTFTIH